MAGVAGAISGLGLVFHLMGLDFLGTLVLFFAFLDFFFFLTNTGTDSYKPCCSKRIRYRYGWYHFVIVTPCPPDIQTNAVHAT